MCAAFVEHNFTKQYFLKWNQFISEVLGCIHQSYVFGVPVAVQLILSGGATVYIGVIVGMLAILNLCKVGAFTTSTL